MVPTLKIEAYDALPCKLVRRHKYCFQTLAPNGGHCNAMHCRHEVLAKPRALASVGASGLLSQLMSINSKNLHA